MTSRIRNLRPDQRLAMLGGLLAVLVAVLLTLQVRDTRQLLHAIDSGRDAAGLARALIEVVLHTQRHRGLAASVLGGAADAEAQRAVGQDAVAQAMLRFGDRLARHAPDARMRNDWQDIGTEWQGLADAVVQRRIGAADSLARHTALIEAELELHDQLLDRFGQATAAGAGDPAWAQAWRAWPRVIEALHRADPDSAAWPVLHARWPALWREQAEAVERQAAAQRQAVIRARSVQAAGLLLVLLLALAIVWRARAAGLSGGPGGAEPPALHESRLEGQRALRRLAQPRPGAAAVANAAAPTDPVPEGERSGP